MEVRRVMRGEPGFSFINKVFGVREMSFPNGSCYVTSVEVFPNVERVSEYGILRTTTKDCILHTPEGNFRVEFIDGGRGRGADFGPHFNTRDQVTVAGYTLTPTANYIPAINVVEEFIRDAARITVDIRKTARGGKEYFSHPDDKNQGWIPVRDSLEGAKRATTYEALVYHLAVWLPMHANRAEDPAWHRHHQGPAYDVIRDFLFLAEHE